MLQWTKPSLLRPRATSNPGGLRKVSSSQSIAKLSSELSCPVLATLESSKQEKIPGSSEVTSSLSIKRKNYLQVAERRQAHGRDYFRYLVAKHLFPSESVTTHLFRYVNLRTASTELSRRRGLGEDMHHTAPSLLSHSSKHLMPKAPQLSFRSPSTTPKMQPPQTEALKVVSPVSPQISFSTSTGSKYDYGPLSSTQAATVTAVLEPHRRSPPPEDRPVLRIIRSTEDEHVLSVRLPGFAPEMVTVSARKDDKLAVVADLWHAETNCHHEWLVAFPARDVNVSLTRAQFSADGTLMIHVPRSNLNCYWTRSRLR